MKPNFTGMQFNSVEDIDKLIEAIEKMPENPNKENSFLKAEVIRRSKMLEALHALRKEADEIVAQEKERQEAEVVKSENDEIEAALERAKQLVKTKKREVTSSIRKQSSSYYGGCSGESRSSESRGSSIIHPSWGYSSGESRCDGESRW